MIQIDTSAWIDHVGHGDASLSALLEARQALTHPFVIGELALGGFNARRRKTILQAIGNLPQVDVVSDDKALGFIEHLSLANQGIGYVDAHLLAAARDSDAALLTRDNKVHAMAEILRFVKL